MTPCYGKVLVKFSISLPLFFVILLSAVPAGSLDFAQGLALRGSAAFSQAGGFGRKAQGLAAVELENTLSGGTFGGTLTVGYHSAAASGIDGGYAYRGWDGVHLWLTGEVYAGPNPPVKPGSGGAAANGKRGPAPDSGRPAVRPGLGAGIGGFFSMYENTENLFFYPALRLLPFADLFFPGSLFRLRFASPLELYLRRDLDSSFSAGMSLSGIFSWGAFMERRRGGIK